MKPVSRAWEEEEVASVLRSLRSYGLPTGFPSIAELLVNQMGQARLAGGHAHGHEEHVPGKAVTFGLLRRQLWVLWETETGRLEVLGAAASCV